MAEKFKGKYRNESARLQSWDYGSNASYFITICTHNREHFFGEINDHKLQISPAGAIAYVLWHEIRNHTENVALGEFVVMPNHVHGILILNGNHVPKLVDASSTVEIHPMSAISPKPNTVSTIIRSYKSAVTKYCNRLGLEFAWQSRFHDHIIRNDGSYIRISEYIKNNPTMWL